SGVPVSWVQLLTWRSSLGRRGARRQDRVQSMSSTSGSGSAAEHPASAATASTKALENCSWAWLMLSPRPSESGVTSDMVFHSVVLVRRLGHVPGRHGYAGLRGRSSRPNRRGGQGLEHPPCLPDRLVEMGHPVLQIA